MKLKPQTAMFWQTVCEFPTGRGGDRTPVLLEVFQIGDSEQSADEGAALIKQGRKTTTSSLLWEYEVADEPLPQVGSLSIVEDGRGKPVCIVETTWVAIKKFAEVDAQFASDYGEWDQYLRGLAHTLLGVLRGTVSQPWKSSHAGDAAGVRAAQDLVSIREGLWQPPNFPFHLTAARLRSCLSRTVTVGRWQVIRRVEPLDRYVLIVLS